MYYKSRKCTLTFTRTQYQNSAMSPGYKLSKEVRNLVQQIFLTKSKPGQKLKTYIPQVNARSIMIHNKPIKTQFRTTTQKGDESQFPMLHFYTNNQHQRLLQWSYKWKQVLGSTYCINVSCCTLSVALYDMCL